MHSTNSEKKMFILRELKFDVIIFTFFLHFENRFENCIFPEELYRD